MKEILLKIKKVVVVYLNIIIHVMINAQAKQNLKIQHIYVNLLFVIILIIIMNKMIVLII